MIRGALALALLAWAPAALAAEYRAFTLSDGRTFVAEVLASEATGMRVRVPAGEMFVSYEVLVDMATVDETAFAGQDDLYVYVVSETPYRTGFQASYRGLQGVTVLGDDDDPILSGDERRAAAMCSTDAACVLDALDDNVHWLWVVVGRMDGLDATFESTVNKGGAPSAIARAPRADVEAVNSAARAVIGLTTGATRIAEPVPVVSGVEPGRPPREPKPPREPGEMTAARAVALSFVPLPGLPNAAAGDWAGFGIGMAAVVPATALWIGPPGKTAQSPAGHVALGLGGYYAATVATNQILSATRLAGNGVAVGVAPTRGQGAQVTVTIAR